jgi:hypothetical protein
MLEPASVEIGLADLLKDEPFDNGVESPVWTKEEIEQFNRLSGVIGHIRDCYYRADQAKNRTVGTWDRSYYQWRGEYTGEEQAAITAMREYNPTASDLYVKISKLKVNAAHAQIMEVLMADTTFPIEVLPTPIPEGVPESLYLDPQGEEEADTQPEDIYGYAGDGEELPPGATAKTLLGNWADKIKNKFPGIQGKFKEGQSPNPVEMPELRPAEIAAARMNKHIQDQIQEENTWVEVSRMVLDMCIFGTGVIKGPFTVFEEIPRWEQDEVTGQKAYAPIIKPLPKVEHVSPYNIFPDPDAERFEDCQWVIELHKYSRNQVAKLKTYTSFNKEAINRVLSTQTPNNQHKNSETESTDNLKDSAYIVPERYEVMEFWGYLDKEMADVLGIYYNPELELIPVNIWLCGDEILKAVLNPFTPTRFPYMITPYEEHPHQLWGIGIPENMADTQRIMNGTMRAAADNSKLSGSLMFEVDRATLETDHDYSIRPGKIWLKDSGAPGQSIFAFKTPSTVLENMQMFDKARMLADEETGIYSLSHGQTGIQPSNRTAAGVSMLMSAAASNIKQVIRNLDSHLLGPMANAYFQWNMQFNADVTVQGDLKIIAKGTQSLMQREISTQRLLSFMQLASNEIIAPYVKFTEILKEFAKNMGLDKDKFINDEATALMFMLARNQGNNNNAQQGNPQEAGVPTGRGQMEASGGNTGGINPQDPTGRGGGNIGVGGVPNPGEAGYSQ